VFGRSWGCWEHSSRHRWDGKPPACLDPGLQLGQSNPLVRVPGENPSQDVVQFIRHWEDALEGIWATGIGPVGGVLERGLLPWVASTGQVDQDHSEAPDIIGGAEVKRSPGIVVQAFWTHVECGAASVVLRSVGRCGEAKVGKLDGLSVVRNKDVLRLQVPVVDSERVAVFNGIQYLQENSLGKIVVPDILTTFSDVEKQVTLRAIFQNDIDAVRVVNNLEHRDHVGVGRGQIVQTDLPVLESNLSAIQWGSIWVELAEALDGITDSGLDIHGGIHDTICASPQDGRQLQLALEEPSQSRLGR